MDELNNQIKLEIATGYKKMKSEQTTSPLLSLYVYWILPRFPLILYFLKYWGAVLCSIPASGWLPYAFLLSHTLHQFSKPMSLICFQCFLFFFLSVIQCRVFVLFIFCMSVFCFTNYWLSSVCSAASLSTQLWIFSCGIFKKANLIKYNLHDRKSGQLGFIFSWTFSKTPHLSLALLNLFITLILTSLLRGSDALMISVGCVQFQFPSQCWSCGTLLRFPSMSSYFLSVFNPAISVLEHV